MKQCPRCNQTYSDDALNFCLEDGELLTVFSTEPPPTRYVDDSPPTLILDRTRVTNPTSWPAPEPSAPPVKWQGGQTNLANPMFGTPGSFVQSTDQTLPTISLILGILSMPMICCFGGVWLGLPAAFLGFLGMRNADNDRNRYGGRGMAIGGMVLGVVSFLATLVYWFFAVLAS